MKRIIFALFAIILFIGIVNVTYSLIVLWGKRDVLTQTKNALAKEQSENVALKEQWGKIHDPNFIEEEARDKLFLAKPGESIVLMPQATPSGSIQVSQMHLPAWQQWLGLFF